MRVLGIVGWSGSGKTTLLTAMLPFLRAGGLKISMIKHAHHNFDMDQPGKDSYRCREAGAHEVLVVSGARWALLHEIAGPEPKMLDLLAKLEPVDLVLVEGYKGQAFPKLEVYRPTLGKPPLWPHSPDVVAVASDIDLSYETCPDVGHRVLLSVNRPDEVAAWIMALFSSPEGNSS